jgi:hypothetical protein
VARGAQKIEGDAGLRHEQIPFSEGELGIAGCKTSTEMILPGLDGAFGRVAWVNMQRDSLEVDNLFLEHFL